MKREILIKNRDVKCRIIEGQAHLIFLDSSNSLGEKIFVLNSTATRIWQFIDEKRTTKDIVRKARSEFSIKNNKALSEINRFINSLLRKKILEIKGGYYDGKRKKKSKKRQD